MRISDWSSDVCSSDLIYGERGIGKTSLMHVLADTARAARYMVVYDSCGADTRFDTMFRSILSRIPLIYHKDTPPNSSEAEKGLTFDSRLDRKSTRLNSSH